MTRAYHQVVSDWCRERLAEAVLASPGRPLVIGISGPQGGGKSELAAGLVRGLGATGVEKRGIAVSIDDFYLTRAGQLEIAARHPGNPYLEHRGYPGTHDLELGVRVLEGLRSGKPTSVPSYDKSAHAGRGDRRPESEWSAVPGPLDFVVFEGWMLGFEPGHRPPVDPWLRAPNDMLAGYGQWNRLVDVWILLRASQDEDIVGWRVDAERVRREEGQPALSDAEARDYIERFLPAYRSWVPGLEARLEGRTALVVELGEDRGAVRLRSNL